MGTSRTFESVLAALREPESEGVVPVDATFRARYQANIDWLLDRLAKSTAGVRGLIAAAVAGAPDLAAAERSPQLSLAMVGLIAQAYADYFSTLEPERRAAFIGFDGRYFSREYAEIFARVFAANGLTARRDQAGEPSPTPVTSFMSVAEGLGGGIMITASHNPPRFNGVKSSTWYGGVDTDDISDRIAGYVRSLTSEGGQIRFAPRASERIGEADAKGLYLERYLRPTFAGESLDQLRAAMRAGARFLFDGLHGVGGLAMTRYLDGLLPDVPWRSSIELLNPTPDPAIGGIEKPDPSDPATLEVSGAIDFLRRHPQTLLSVTADMDADRIGTAALLPASEVARARTFGLFVSEFGGAGGSVWAVRFTPNQLFTLIAYDRMLAAARERLGVTDPNQLAAMAGSGKARRFHLITSLATSVLAEKLARTFGLSFHLTAVGFKNLGRLAYEIDARREGDVILCLMEESGGAQVGPFVPWNERGDTIHRDKDTCALALALFCLAARLRNEGRTLLDFYLEMAERFGVLCYYERLDAYLPDQATAEHPARQAEANRAKEEVLGRLVALQQSERQEQLLRLFDVAAAGPLTTRDLGEIALMEKVGDWWEVVHPTAAVIPLASGGRLEWFRAGSFDHDGMKISLFDAAGEVTAWCLVRASGTEAVLRVYMEIVEPVDHPHPERLAELFSPLLQYLGFNDYRLRPGSPSYAEAFRQAVREKYGHR
jgi:phosphomannomutase